MTAFSDLPPLAASMASACTLAAPFTARPLPPSSRTTTATEPAAFPTCHISIFVSFLKPAARRAPHARRTNVPALAAPAAGQISLRWGGWPVSRSALVLVVDVEEHGGEQHQALDELLVVDADAHDRHAVVHDAHDEGADDRAGDLADAARGRGAADEAGRDDVELEADAGLRRCRIEAGGDDHAGERGERPHIDEGVEGQ